jgi:hypothetical protein
VVTPLRVDEIVLVEVEVLVLVDPPVLVPLVVVDIEYTTPP